MESWNVWIFHTRKFVSDLMESGHVWMPVTAQLHVRLACPHLTQSESVRQAKWDGGRNEQRQGQGRGPSPKKQLPLMTTYNFTLETTQIGLFVGVGLFESLPK